MEDLILSYSSLAAFKRCRKSYYYLYERRREPREMPGSVEAGKELHRILELAGKGLPLAEIIPEGAHGQQMMLVAAQYIAHRPFPRNIVGVEQAYYTVLLPPSSLYLSDGSLVETPRVILRTTFDLVFKDVPTKWVWGKDYKGLALDTVLPTTDGWTTMRDVQVGARVFGADGEPCNVTAKSAVHYKPCFRVCFDDGTSIIADHEHRWVLGGIAGRKHERRAPKVVTTEQLVVGARIATSAPLATEELSLPVDPYVLGAWLGDGTTANGTITSCDPEIFDEIERRGYILSTPRGTGKAKVRTIFGLTQGLRRAGVLNNKHIPEAYLRASYTQRVLLLQGLMDTNGSWHKRRKRAVFVQVDHGLARQARELVLSLGVTCTLFGGIRGRGFGKNVLRADVCFTPFAFNPFRLTRKANLVPKALLGANPRRIQAHNLRRIVRSVEPCVTVPTQCITVDSTDSTYLCTSSMLPTHNSFERAPSMHTDLDFQSRLYSQVLRLHYPKAAGSGFVIEHIRRSPIGTTNSKGTWSPEECIITETAVYSERELTELWGETQDVAVDLVRCRLEKRWYRQDLKVGPHSCSTCFVRDVCIADVQGRLDAETLNMLTLERDPLALPDGHPLLDDTV